MVDNSPKILRFISVSNFLSNHINELVKSDSNGLHFLNLNFGSVPVSLAGNVSLIDSIFTSIFSGAPHNTQFKLKVWLYEYGHIKRVDIEDRSEIFPYDTFDSYIQLKLANVSKGLPIVAFFVSFEDGNPRHTWLIITSN